MMAKHGKRRKFRRYIKGSINHRVRLDTLASKTVLATNIGNTVADTAYCSSIRATWSLDNVTKATNVGPVLVGIAHSDYTGTEIEEWIESLVNWDEGNLVAAERRRRKIRRVGVFSNADEPTTWSVLNDGKPLTTKAGWILMEGQTIKIWVYNMGGLAFSTTDPNMRVEGHANLWPQ